MLPIDTNSVLPGETPAAICEEALTALVPEIDHLALQVMLQGAQACTLEAMTAILTAARLFNLTQFEQPAQELVDLQLKGSLTDEEAKHRVSELQSLMTPDTEPIEPSADVAPDPGLLAFADDPELLADFVMEADEHLASIEEKILQLEKDSAQIEAIHAVFRSFHSIKGLAGFLGLAGVQSVAHEVETMLDHARNLRITVNSNVVDIVLESSEYLKDEVELIRAKLAGLPLTAVRDNSALLALLTAANADIAAGRPFLVASDSSMEAAETPDLAPAPEEIACAGPTSETNQTEGLPEQSVAEAPPAPLEEPSVQESSPEEVAPVFPSTLTLVPPPPPPPTRINAPLETATAPSAISRVETANTSIRVETAKLDRLMDMVGEMVIAQSILSNKRLESATEGTQITGEMSKLARITSEVQRCAMSMRMMPIGPLFQKNAKMVRDLSRRNGKQVSLELFGESTELDKSIAEELSDPLLHMIRNALDHGIETPAERALTGKPLTASLRIAAEHQAGQIVISISDDGRGLDPVKIRNKALQNKLIDENEQLSESEIFQLIFAPGFSTAEKITDISGRGVGMDVVRQHVESLRGRIEIRSKLGEGTTFFIHLPLTLAIIEGLVIIVGEHRYIIPLYSVREMIRPTEDMLYTVQGADEVILMRGSLLPLVRLHQRFGILSRTTDICEGLLVVCEFAGKRYCLFVDDLLGRQEVVIKSLDEAFRKVRGLVGSAILGDGRIGLILDVAGVFNSNTQEREVHYA